MYMYLRLHFCEWSNFRFVRNSTSKGPIGAANLYAPEAQLLNSPLIIGYLNGMSSLVDLGLTR